MPRRGDEANRLGNEYEGLWIADSLLDVLAGDATSITVAAFGEEGHGIDLIKQTKDGSREFHSLKRQTTNPTWKLRELSERRVFDELLGKLGLGTNHKAVFVSGTTPNDLNELCERASRSKSLSAFQSQLNASPALRAEFESHFLPHCAQDWNVAWNNLLRLRVGGMPSGELDGRISQKIRFLVQRKDGKSWSPLEVRLLLTHLVLEWLGQAIEKRVILEYLSAHGLVERTYLGERSLLDRVQALAANYISDVEGELIHGHQIERSESKAAFDALTNGQNEIVAVIGAAGLGSRVAVRAVAPCCTEENYRNLEQAILQFEEFGERSRKGGRGYKRFLLLTALPQSQRSSKAQSEFEQLARKFPGERDGPLQSSGGVFSIESPIGIDARKKMTDEQWVRAMEKYSKKRSRETYEEWRKGGCDELAGALKTDTAQDKSRFAALALKMPTDLPPVFFARLLDGLVETEPPKDGQPENPETTRLLDTETMVVVLRRIHGLPGRPCGRSISWAVRKLADRPLPDEVLEMVAHYATNDPDPTEEEWKTPAAGGTPYYGGDPEFAGLNCNRGAAADTLAKLLFADKGRWLKLQAAIQSVSRDRIFAVRTMAIECLTAALNVDRNWPVEEFLKLADGAEEILGGHNADWFLHYTTMTHYEALRPLLLRMLKAPDEKVRKVAARRITVAALHEKAASDDLAIVLHGDPVCRAAAAEVFSDGLGYEPVRAKCREHLKKLFNDPEKSVRDTTDHCFRKVSDEQLSEEVDLIASFINSEAFADDAAQLCFALKESTSLLPDVVCGVAERLIQLHRQRHGQQAFDRFYSSGHYISELIVRLYQQTMDARTKSRCLDIIDEMLRVEIWSADEELEKAER